MKKVGRIFILFVIITTALQAQVFKLGEAKGMFMSIGVGPRFSLGDFADSRNIGVGGDVAVSYTDNQFLPVFFYASVGFSHFPGRQEYYRKTDLSSISTNMLVFQGGLRYYFPTLIDQFLIVMPVVDVGVTLAYFENLHQYKISTGKPDLVEEIGKPGFHIGGGFSMFILDVLAYYNYLHDNQYLSVDFRVRIPIYVNY